jgi:hypothetical protein
LSKLLALFNEHYLTSQELYRFIETLQKFETTYGAKACWCLKTVTKSEVKGFSTSHSTKPFFKGIDARPLLLAVLDQYPNWEKPLVVRHHECKSPHCINPNHYYFGTKKDICFERGWRRGSRVTPQLVEELREKYEFQNTSLTSLAKSYKLPYHVVRGICRYLSYE